MEKSKIKALNFNRVYSGKNGEVTVYNATMENNQFGELHTTKDKYKIGDEISYELDSRQYNNNTIWSIKVKTPSASFGGAGSKGESIEKQFQIARMAAIKSSVDLILGQQISIKDLLPTAEKITNYIINGYGKNNGNL